MERAINILGAISRVQDWTVKKRPQTGWGVLQLCIAVLDILHVVLSITPLSAIVSVIWYNIIGIPLNEIVFVSILVLLPIVCARSFLMMLTSKPKDMEFRTLFYESLFGKQSEVLKSPFPILTLIAVPLSLWYIWTIVTYAYYNWEIAFAQFFHPLQLYPVVFFFFQTLFQGCFLLWMFSLPSFAQKLEQQETFASAIQEYINTNFVLLIHSICLIVIVLENEIAVPNFDNLVIGEIFYRSLALVAFFSLKWKMNRKKTQPAIDDTDQNQPFPNVIEPVETSETGYASSEFIGHDLLQNSNTTQPAIEDTQRSRNMTVPRETSETRYDPEFVGHGLLQSSNTIQPATEDAQPSPNMTVPRETSETRYDSSEYVGHGFLLNISTQNTAIVSSSTNSGSSSLSESPSFFISAESVSSQYEEDTVPPPPLDRVHEQCSDMNTNIPHRDRICFISP